MLLKVTDSEIEVDENNINSLCFNTSCFNRTGNVSNIFFWEKTELGSLGNNSLKKLAVLLMK